MQITRLPSGGWLRLKELFGLERNVLVISGTLFVLVTCWLSWYLLLPLYLRQLGATDYQIGISYTLLALSFSLGQIFGGALGDRFGRKPLIALPTFSFFVLYLIGGWTKSWLLLLACLILADTASAFQEPSFTSIIAESVPEGKRGAAFGVLGFAFSCGLLVGPFLGSLLIDRVGFPFLIRATAIMAVPCATIRLIALRETVPTESRKAPQKIRFSLDRNLRWLLGGVVAMMLVFNLTIWGPFIAIYARDSIGLVKKDINLLFTVGGISAVVFSLLGGKVVERLKGKRVFMAGAFLHPLCLMPWLFTKGVVAGAPLFILAYLFSQSAHIAHKTLLSDLTTESTRSSIVGLFGTVGGILASFAPSLGMMLKLRVGETAPFFAALLLGIVGALVLLPVSQE